MVHPKRRVVALAAALTGLVAGVLGTVPAAQAAVDPYRVTTLGTLSASGPVTLSDDGALLAVAEGPSVALFATAGDTPLGTLTLSGGSGGGPVVSLDFASATALVVATASGVEFVSWTASASTGAVTQTADLVMAAPTGVARVVAVSPTSAYVLDTLGGIWLDDASAAGSTAWTSTSLELPSTGGYRAIAYTSLPAPRLYAITATELQEVSTARTTSALVSRLTLNAPARSLAISPDGEHLFIGEDNQLAVVATASGVQSTTTTLPAKVSNAYPAAPSTWAPKPPQAPLAEWGNLPELAGSSNGGSVSCDTLTVSTDGASVYCTGTDTSTAHGIYWFNADGSTLSFGGAHDVSVLAQSGLTQPIAATGARVYATLSDNSVTSVPEATILADEGIPRGSRPSAPQGVTATSTTPTTIDVSWSAPLSDGGQKVLGYLVTATSGTTTTYCAPGATGTSCTLTGLTSRQPYSISVAAANVLGPGSPSDAASVTPGIPGLVRDIKLGLPVLGTTSTSLPVTWTAPTSAGETAIRGYFLCAAPVVPGSTSSSCQVPNPPISSATCNAASLTVCAGASATAATIPGLTPNTTYQVTVTAYNETSAGIVSTPLSITPGAPSAPTGLTAKVQNQSITLTWQPPAFSGVVVTKGTTGSTIVANASVTYTAFLEPGHRQCAGTAAAGSSLLSCTMTGLTNGTTYTASVYAWAGAIATGLTSPAATLTDLVPATVPGAPTVTNVTTSPGTVVITWSAPTSDGGSPIVGYTATAHTGAQTASCTTVTALTCTISGLVNAASYGVSVTALNAIGSGLASKSVLAMPVGPPSSVRAVQVSVTGSTAEIGWDAPASIGSAAVASYAVVATSAHDHKVCGATSDTSCRIGGLVPGETYAVSVVATNDAGYSSPASAPVVALALAAPAAPSAVLKKHRNHRANVVLRWAGIAGAGSYQVTRTGGPVLKAKRTVKGTSLTFKKLPRGRYKFTLVALGPGTRSAASTTLKVRIT